MDFQEDRNVKNEGDRINVTLCGAGNTCRHGDRHGVLILRLANLNVA